MNHYHQLLMGQSYLLYCQYILLFLIHHIQHHCRCRWCSYHRNHSIQLDIYNRFLLSLLIHNYMLMNPHNQLFQFRRKLHLHQYHLNNFHHNPSNNILGTRSNLLHHHYLNHRNCLMPGYYNYKHYCLCSQLILIHHISHQNQYHLYSHHNHKLVYFHFLLLDCWLIHSRQIHYCQYLLDH